MTVEYDPTIGTACTAFALKDTVISQVLCRFEFYLLLAAHVGCRVAINMGYFTPEKYNLNLPMGLTGVTGSLMTFFVVFYNGNVFGRYNRFYDLTKNLNENCLNVVMILTREISDPALKRKLVKMCLASCFLFFFERTPSKDDLPAGHDKEDQHNISEEEWSILLRIGLLDQQQEIRLRDHCNELKKNAMPSLVLLNWSMKLYRLDQERHNDLEKAYWEVRRMQDDVVEMLELPMPWQYFHIMNLMMMLNLTLWAYSFALEPSHFGSLIFVFVEAIFMGIRELSVALADPYGDDAADFPINEWMDQLYSRVVYFLNEDWAAADMMLVSDDQPMPPVIHSVHFDLITEVRKPSNPSARKRVAQVSARDKAKATNNGQQLPQPEVILRDVDGSGSYIRIPSATSEEEMLHSDSDHKYAHAD